MDSAYAGMTPVALRASAVNLFFHYNQRIRSEHRLAQAALIPLGAAVMMAMFLLVMRRARNDSAMAHMPVPAE